MVAARASVSPTMSPMQQKLMQYLPVVFAVFLVFYLTGLVIYYMAQAIFRIGLQWDTTRRFYKGDESLGRQAMAAGEKALEMAKNEPGGGGLFGQMKKEAAAAKDSAAKNAKPSSSTTAAGVSPGP
jgi:YidC/Oxa1 family membrane protein insertase